MNTGPLSLRYTFPSAVPRLVISVFGISHNWVHDHHFRIVAVARSVGHPLEPSEDGLMSIDKYQLDVRVAGAGAVNGTSI